VKQRWLDVKESFLPAGVARLNWQKGLGTRTANENALKQLRSDAERHGLAPTEIKELVDNATRRRQDSAPKAAQALDEMRRTGGLHTAADAANGLSTEGVVRLELAEALGADWVALVGGEEAAPGLVADGVAYLELLAKERWEGGLRAAALGGEYQPTAARPATLSRRSRPRRGCGARAHACCARCLCGAGLRRLGQGEGSDWWCHTTRTGRTWWYGCVRWAGCSPTRRPGCPGATARPTWPPSTRRTRPLCAPCASGCNGWRRQRRGQRRGRQRWRRQRRRRQRRRRQRRRRRPIGSFLMRCLQRCRTECESA
jgi:hypothetical protein